MTAPIIETPRGSIIINEANMKAELIWNPGSFNGGGGGKGSWQDRFSNAQKFVDHEILRGCEPYVPLLTGMLKMSGILGTVPGEGVVSWIAPYARRNYYSKRAPGSATGPLRGPFWFARWKPIGAPAVIAGARKIAGGGQ
jgi:hypothetical protein